MVWEYFIQPNDWGVRAIAQANNWALGVTGNLWHAKHSTLIGRRRYDGVGECSLDLRQI